MLEPQEDVNVAPSTTEQVVNEPEIDQQAEQQPEETQTTSPQEVKPESQVDERGVPMSNVYAEMNRKFSETQTQLQQLASLLQEKSQATQSPQSQIADEQLLWCVEDPNATPEAKFYAKSELRKRDDAKQEKKLKEVFNTYTEEQKVNQQRSQSFNWFSSNFPDAVSRDAMGNAIGINSNHPLVLKMNEYMQDPMAAKRGDALIIAAKNAAFDLGYVANKGLSKKLNQTTAQLKREQKKTLIGGSGVNPQDTGKSNVLKIAEQYQKTQNPNAFKELIKKRGLIPQ